MVQLHGIKGCNYSLHSGNATADQVIFVLLSTQMFVGGFVGLFLDNTIPGKSQLIIQV